jgi:hypothetical protein
MGGHYEVHPWPEDGPGEGLPGETPASVPDASGADVRALAGQQTQATAEEIKASLGIGVPRERYREPGRDVSGLAEGLGLK